MSLKSQVQKLVFHKFGQLPNPKNQHQQALWYLHEWKQFSIVDVINHSMFFKFQSRLSDIENDNFINLADRTRKSFVNKFGNKSTYNLYSRSVSKEKLFELFIKYGKNGSD